MSTADNLPHPLETIADDFVQRCRRGESPSVVEYTAQFPEHADEISNLLASLAILEQLKQQNEACFERFQRITQQAGDRLGDYDIVREIGRGGMGIVYEARQPSLDRRVALKILASRSADSERSLERFRREVRAASRLHHTNIVPIFDVGCDEGVHFYVMPYVDGHSLEDVVRVLRQRVLASLEWPASRTHSVDNSRSLRDPVARFDPPSAKGRQATITINEAGRDAAFAPADDVSLEAIPEFFRQAEFGTPDYYRRAAQLASQAAAALQYAHDQGVLHRDIKPANLLLDRQGTLRLTDFGLAKLTQAGDLTESGDLMGTYCYMAPERFDGRADTRSDVYSLGVTLYELLTLRPAFRAANPMRLMRQILNAAPPRPRQVQPSIPRQLETIVLRAIARDPQHRYATAGELAEDFARFAAGGKVRARRIPLHGKLWSRGRRNKPLASMLFLSLALGILVPVLHAWNSYQADVAWKQAHAFRDEAHEARRHEQVERQRASSERQRAEMNLSLVMQASERLLNLLEDELLPAALVEGEQEHEVTGSRDAAMLAHLLAMLDQLAARNGSQQFLADSASLHRRAAEFAQRQGDIAAAESGFQRALQIASDLAIRYPQHSQYQLQTAITCNRFGIALQELGRNAEALDLHEQAEQWLRELPADEPLLARQCQYELANTYNQLGVVSSAAGDPRYDAPQQHRFASSLAQTLLDAEPDEPAYRLLLARSQRLLAQACLRDGDALQAAASISRSHDALRSLADSYPDSPVVLFEWAETLAAQLQLPGGTGQRERQQLATADQVVRLYLQIQEPWAQRLRYRAALAVAHRRRAQWRACNGDVAGADRDLAEAYDMQQTLVEQCPEHAEHRLEFELLKTLRPG